MSKRIRNIAIGIVLWTAFANAGDPKRADKLFNEALALSDKGNYLLAAEKYEASAKEDPSIGAYTNLGECYVRLTRYASAYDAMSTAADLARVRNDKREKPLRERMVEVLPKVPRFRLVVGDPTLRVTSVRVGSLGINEPAWRTLFTLPAGEREIVAETNRGEWRKQITVGESASDVAILSVDVAPVVVQPPAQTLAEVPKSAPPTDPPQAPRITESSLAPASSSSSAMPVIGWTLLGVGSAAILTSLTMGGMILGRQETGKAASDGDFALARVATIVGISGGVLAASGGAILLFGTPKAVNASLYIAPTTFGFLGAF